ncbi:MAG: methylmalonyl-CoA mutase family protein [Bacteroidetes bacterium]|nr:methylmalonyl-CoA mutase family protein [Bacteroidota bacterium]MDE2671427.1 methylmalonyl-CoA mutase family protein [Bacteroidota bacterium]
MSEPLDLLSRFPPVADQDWEKLIPDNLNWHPIEGITVRPYYRRGKTTPKHIFSHREWLIRADVEMEDAVRAQLAGADALGFNLPKEKTKLPEDLPIGTIPLFFSGKGATPKLLETLRMRAASKGYAPEELRGAVDISSEYPACQVLDMAKGTRLWTLCISLEPWHEQGATHVQELACALAQLSDLLAEAGSSLATEHLYFTVPVGERYLLDIARLRALRVGAAGVLDAYNVRSQKVNIVGVPSRRYESALDPETHLIRQSLQCVAAILGGCDVIATPDADLGLQMQQIMRYEGRLGVAADVAAGAWIIEHLTDALGAASWQLFQKIEQMGGLDQSWHWIEKQIQQKRNQRNAAVHSGADVVVGVNTYLATEIPEVAPYPNSLAAPLEAIRLRAKALTKKPRVEIRGEHDPWLRRLLSLCSCDIRKHSANIVITITPTGFTAQNTQGEQASLTSGDPLHLAADQLFRLLDSDAA